MAYSVAKAQGINTKVYLDGFSDVKRTLRKLGKDAEDMKPTMKRIADIVAAQAKAEAPVQSGKLQGSIRGRGTKTQASVLAGNERSGKAGVPYFNPIHWGWPDRNIEANMFMYRALNEKLPTVRAIMDKELLRLATKYSAPKYFSQRFFK